MVGVVVIRWDDYDGSRRGGRHRSDGGGCHGGNGSLVVVGWVVVGGFVVDDVPCNVSM